MIKSFIGFLFFLCLVVAELKAGGDAFIYYHLPDGLEVVLLQEDSNQAAAQIVIRGGYFVEGENSKGLSYCLGQYLTNDRHLHEFAHAQDLSLEYRSQNYYSQIDIKGKNNLIRNTFAILDSLRKAPIYPAGIKAINKSLKNASEETTNPQKQRLLWTGNTYSQGIPKQTDSFQNYELGFIQLFREKMLQNSNLLLILPGTQANKKFFDEYLKANIDFGNIFPQYIKSYNFQQERPLVYSYQLEGKTLEAANGCAMHFYYHAPGAAAHKEEIMAGLLLADMVNRPGSLLHKSICKKFNCLSVSASFEITNKSGEWEFICRANKLTDSITRPDYLINSLLADTNYLNSEFKKSMEVLPYEFKQKALKDDQDLLKIYWSGKNFELLQSYDESWALMHPLHLQAFIYKYLYQLPYLAQLDADSITMSEEYISFDDSLVHYELSYERNKYLPKDARKDEVLSKYLQFLRINEWSGIQVNALADASEFLQVKDTRMNSFLDTVPSMRLVSRQIVDSKSTRLDMLRSLKILQYFYRNGIGSERLFGTGFVRKGESEAERAINRKVSFSLTGLRQSTNYEILSKLENRLDEIKKQREEELFKKKITQSTSVNLLERSKSGNEKAANREVLIGNTPK